MQLKDYLSQQRGNAKWLAKKLGISMSFLSQMASSSAPISPRRAIEIERYTDGMVTRADCLPSEWVHIWPEFTPRSCKAAVNEAAPKEQ
ncbi:MULTISPECIES: transcriptional regulator [Atlantibacter]|uniref:transcriptional regulator n=1 Tax=Atlantibacter TaxID=1903434 RepID=UPI001181FB19|nr:MULTISPECIES: YdaS family helix-turn-helix protein [Atlantibacter]EFH9598768.1 helix-turn-helix domain-containing protein [Escherichia coli]MDU7813302.1 YdaS family helix-turn-helix protein [Atlantibacter hermannii]MDW2743379.1 YdaS family helix-turn-helix protein [Atlantibacter subterranea]TSJ59566.1 helix-turn-helix domain-containing protein [Atlantibacter subterranea]